MMNIEQLSNEAKSLAELVNLNLRSLNGRLSEVDEIQDYYLGMLRRQAILLLDMEVILKDRDPKRIATPFIILRSLIDDFLHVLFLELQEDKEQSIIEINADAYKQAFKSIENLKKSNTIHSDNKYGLLVTNELYQELKDKFTADKDNDKYFKNKDNFEFKPFMNLSTLTTRITYSQEVEIEKESAYFLWKQFSNFVHYSMYSYHYEEMSEPLDELFKIEAGFKYSYNTIYLAFKYFERSLNLDFIDNVKLKGRYPRILEC